MNQITEDYVSYEIAVLLKEKRFDIPCEQAYFNGSLVDYTMYGFCDGELLDCPSQSLALKWLREVHNIFIEIYRTACGYLYIISNIHYGTDLYNPEYCGDDKNSGQWTTYEKCVEAALKYTLENLI